MSNMLAKSIHYSLITAGMLVKLKFSKQSEINALITSVNKKAELATFTLWFSDGGRWDNYVLTFRDIETWKLTLLSDCGAKST